MPAGRPGLALPVALTTFAGSIGCTRPKKRADRVSHASPAGRMNRLLSGDRVLDEVGALHPRELDGKAVVEMPHHTPRRLADAQGRADRWPMIADHGDTRHRQVNDAAFLRGAVLQHQRGGLVAGGDALVATVLGKIEHMAVGEPGELGGELVALA